MEGGKEGRNGGYTMADYINYNIHRYRFSWYYYVTPDAYHRIRR